MFESYIERWRLTIDGELVVTHSSQLLPVLWNGRPAMLKISGDAAEKAGGALMHWWNGIGAATVYAHDDEAVLLERATGSHSLLAMAMSGGDNEATRILCRTAVKLHIPRGTPPPPLIPLSQWFRELEPAARRHGGVLTDCSRIADALLADPPDPVVLHGDVHHGNILDFDEHGWLAIDPKGLLGEPAFDFANIFANEDLPTINAPGRLQRQLPIVSSETGIEPKRLLQWIVAYSGLSAAWFIGDGSFALAESPLSVARIALAELQ
ncbi:aminoglycoside phosphotransferase family protein [Rhizobium sp. Root1220]|uniref:aminoglycoside phosphotransferase family protein n=1 Tax=Rhizobium sp. Root1220 TaxID=1736432 RepID=UPI0006F4EBA5|nr:aminoglycoside phosphotransferase family protein [Rhizobium sp. Root1220]KQV64474.1 3'-kinase [Rhizobium sp. Root1220]